MYAQIVRRIIRDGFRQLSGGNPQPVLDKFAPDAHFVFLGTHAMGADLRTPDAIRQWFERVLRLFPGIEFEPVVVNVSGMPWNTLVVVQLATRATLPDGRAYRNKGLQMVRLRWGKIVEDLVYEDTHILIDELQNLGQQGVSEALAQPIRDAA